MSNNIELSVIVPVYNVEKYIKPCVDSILNQTFKDLEVILVNDCTPDNSMKICEEAYGNNSRVRLLNQPKNMGAGEARNRGISEARGKYIGFVDSDDQILPDMYAGMMKLANEYNADVVHNTGIRPIVPTKGNDVPANMMDPEAALMFTSYVDVPPAKEVTLVTDDMNERVNNWINHGYHWAVWNQIYRKDFLLEHNIRFGEMKLGEDFIFSCLSMFNAKRYVINPGCWYIYRPSPTSLSRSSKNPQRALKALFSEVKGLIFLRREAEKIPFFRDNPERLLPIMHHFMMSIEDGFIRIDFQNMGEAGIREGGIIHDFFVQEFGEKSDFVEFLFYELHKYYPEIIDGLAATSDPEVWATIRRNYPKYLESKDPKDLWEGLPG